MRRELLAMVFVAALVVFSLLLTLPVRFIEPDDATYYAAMRAFAEGKLVVTRSELVELQREVAEKGLAVGGFRSIQYVNVGMGYALEKAPGYPFILAFFHKLGIERFVNFIFGLLAIPVFYRMVARAFDPKAALISSLILLSNATFLAMFYRVYMSDFVSMVFVLLGLAFFYLGLEGDDWKRGVLSGLSLGFSVLVRYTNAVAYAALLVYSLWLTRKGGRKALRYSGIVLGASIPMFLLLMAYNNSVFGSPFSVGYSKTIGYTNFAFQYILAGRLEEGLGLLWRNLLTHPKLLLEGFPSLVLLPVGVYIGRKNRATLLLLLWFLAYFGLYFQYEWLRTGLYIFMTRFYLPMAPALAALAGVAIGKLVEERKGWVIGYALLALVLLIDISSLQAFFGFALSGRPAPRIGGPISGPGRGAPPGRG
ncbi:glycosyltransferase family 39 protein [Thermococcus stetteri]|uniref:glycosyltransferase family 39 protein n=1 Tax=Thermococcus stetteri TaxID=49900 RepID=UPI001AE7B952|nr:glycosyltransferase family 39 protein [Thermococcus stetteri]MBP1912604.1 4-amino-4-deoxy-L-arabinose transferase-like glycosyltransferase [Thermococcus stetteri]